MNRIISPWGLLMKGNRGLFSWLMGFVIRSWRLRMMASWWLEKGKEWRNSIGYSRRIMALSELKMPNRKGCFWPLIPWGKDPLWREMPWICGSSGKSLRIKIWTGPASYMIPCNKRWSTCHNPRYVNNKQFAYGNRTTVSTSDGPSTKLVKFT